MRQEHQQVGRREGPELFAERRHDPFVTFALRDDEHGFPELWNVLNAGTMRFVVVEEPNFRTCDRDMFEQPDDELLDGSGQLEFGVSEERKGPVGSLDYSDRGERRTWFRVLDFLFHGGYLSFGFGGFGGNSQVGV
jgi:hypothetical protein